MPTAVKLSGLESPSVAVALLRQFATRLRATDRLPVMAAIPPRPPAPPHPVAVSVTAAGAFDPGADGYFDDPYAHLAPLREQAAVHWSEAVGSWVVTRYDDVQRLSRDRSLLGSVGTQDPAATLAGAPSEAARRRRLDKTMTRRDGDDHRRLRRLVSMVFTPRAVSSWRDRADRITEQLLAEAAAATAAGRAMFDYLGQVVADKRHDPGDDILTALIAAEEAGDRLDTEEIQAQVMLLYVAGHETTANLIGNGLTNLFRFPDQMDLLRADPGLDANAVEELLRYDSPAQFTRRVNREPLDVGGITIPEGSLITLALGSANRDPRQWGPTADAVDVARPGANEHVSFGGGSHFCLGNALARLEAQVALPKLLRRFPRMEPASTEPAWMQRITLRGVETLPVVLR